MQDQTHMTHAVNRPRRRARTAFLTALSFFLLNLAAWQAPVHAEPVELRVVDELEVGRIFAGTSLAATVLTHGEHQYVVHYNADQQMTIAHRTLDSRQWAKRELPLNANWNNHRGITLAVDSEGLLHLSGNMHANPLVYWRSTEPHAIDTLEEINRMVGEKEGRVTYGRFRETPHGELTYWYRYGGSGNGQRLVNVWDPQEQSWSRLLAEPLFDGLGEVNVYPSGPHRGPEGGFHYAFMWRVTPDAVTNHHISYVWSKDLKNWKTVGGKIVDLPITRATRGVVVDPVPPGEGLINMGYGVGFDAENRPVIHYHNYDDNGNSQIYNARWEGNGWKIYQTSDWEWRWEFGGWGAIPSKVRAGAVQPTEDGYLSQPYSNERYGSGVWKLDPDTLQPVGELPPRGHQLPADLQYPQSDFTHEDGSAMQVRWASDLGESDEPGVRYYVRWETLPVNRDRPRRGKIPEPSTLMLYELKEPAQGE